MPSVKTFRSIPSFWAIAAVILLALAPRARAWEENVLRIWINGDKGYQGIEEIGKVFTENTGVPVVVEHPDGVPDKFFNAAKSGRGPDILIWAHDRLGEWADAGLLLPIDPDPAFTNRIYPKAWEGFTHRGRLWGYPIAMEVTGLIYNKALITPDQIPADLADCADLAAPLAAKNASPIMWDYNNSYFTFGILASDGGYVFGRDAAGDYDVRDIGVNAPGAVEALTAIRGLIENGTMPTALSYSIAEERMATGRLAMFISGPFAWANLRKSGIDFGVATIPGIHGKPARPFVGIVGAMYNRSSPDLELAQEFLEHYLITPEGLSAMNRHVALGVPALKAYAETLSSDLLIAGAMQNVEAGLLMPNIPQMGAFWSAMESTLSNVTAGQESPQSALDHAAARILRAAP
jgi:maltose/maltodextrin transport system substrate-binding protein